MIYLLISFSKSGDLSLNLPCILLILPTLRIVSKIIMEAFFVNVLFWRSFYKDNDASTRIDYWMVTRSLSPLYNKSTNVIILGPNIYIIYIYSSGFWTIQRLLSFLSSKISFSSWFSFIFLSPSCHIKRK